MDSQIEEIKNKLNVVDLVGSYVKLTKTGANLRGICPFHSEKKPSFFVSPARQMWHCFGCGAGSSIFDFVMKIEGIEFGDALRMLAQKAGIQLKKENVQLRTERQRLYEICDLACKFFEKQLEASVVGKEAKEYLLKRGITQESITAWRLGYSPDTWNGLSDFLIGQGYAREEIIKAGLAIVPIPKESRILDGEAIGKKEDNVSHSYDRFRGRIIFPVFDLNSQVVGFGGRVFKAANEKEVAKYINTPQTLLYDKSGVLYGLNNAKLAVRKQNGCVVVEGYTDVIMCHQAGYENTVAASGTALTARHLAILKRYSENLLLAFDMDVAGDSATKRGISLAQEQGFNIKIIESYVKDSDPADIILKDRALWQESLDKATSIMDYYFNSAFAGFDVTVPEGKKEIANRVLPAIKRLQNKIEQSYWVQKLSQKLDVKEEAVLEELARVKITPSQQAPPLTVVPPQNNAPVTIEGRKELIEKKIISLILKNPEYLALISESHYPLFSEKIASFLLKLKKLIQDQKEATLGEVEKPFGSIRQAQDRSAQGEDFKVIFDAMTLSGAKTEDEQFNYELKNFLAALALSAEIEYQEDGQEEMQLCLLQLKNIELKKKLNAISDQIKKAEASGDHQTVAGLIGQFNTLTKEL